MAYILIKSLPYGTKVLRSLIDSSIKEDNCSDVRNIFSRHCANGISIIQDVGFCLAHIPVSRADNFITNISILDMYRLNVILLYVSNALKNTNVPIHLRFCAIQTPYYLDWSENLTPMFF